MLVGISGKFGVGKDTLVEKILEYLKEKEVKCAHLKFADNLKQVCSIVTGTKLEDHYSQEGKEKMVKEIGMTIGRLQQVLGTSLGVSVHPDIWVLPIIKFHQNNPDTVCIISDCRFKNEAKEIRNNGGVILRINRNIKVDNGRDPTHISEVDLDDYTFDFVIENNGTVNEMVDKAFSFLKFI